MDDKPEEILAKNLFFLTSALSRRLTKQADEMFEAMGLSSSHALLLLLIKDNPEIQPSQLAEKINLKPSTITRLVQKLERRELVDKKPQGRAISIVCTRNGQELSADIEAKWQKLIQEKRDELGDRYVEVMSEMVANALDTMDEE